MLPETKNEIDLIAAHAGLTLSPEQIETLTIGYRYIQNMIASVHAPIGTGGVFARPSTRPGGDAPA